MTPISDIEKLERLLAEATPGPWHDCPTTDGIPHIASWKGEAIADFYLYGAPGGGFNLPLVVALRNLAPSLIADWKQMRGEIERLTKERDEAYEEAAQVCIVEANADTSGDDWGDGFNTGCLACARDIRDLKAKEPKP